MQIKYFQTAWSDIKNSPGWFGKLCILALVEFIPIFGTVVVSGYLYGWAREMAWGIHQPLPAKVFGNEDGKLYRRGWFIFVLAFALTLVPSIITGIGNAALQTSSLRYYSDVSALSFGLSASAGMALYLVGLVLAVVVSLFQWVGSMRIAIYDRLSPGFQLGTIWKMMRRDAGGIARIFGMNLLVGIIVGVVLGIVFTVLIAIIAFAGASSLVNSGYIGSDIGSMSDSQAVSLLLHIMMAAGPFGLIGLLAAVFAAFVASAFIEALTARALGYWTMQFDVPHWRGQDDPLPFELPPTPPAYGGYPQA